MSKLTGPVAAIAEISRMGDENLGSWLREYEGYRGTLVFVDDDANTARLNPRGDRAADYAGAPASRGAMRDQLATTAGMEVVEFGVYEVPAWDFVSPA